MLLNKKLQKTNQSVEHNSLKSRSGNLIYGFIYSIPIRLAVFGNKFASLLPKNRAETFVGF